MNSSVALAFGGLIVLTLAGCSDDTRGADGEPDASPLAEYLGSVARLDYDSGDHRDELEHFRDYLVEAYGEASFSSD